VAITDGYIKQLVIFIHHWYFLGRGSNVAKKPPLGTGERFKQLTATLKRRGVKDPEALAAWIGRKKYGKKRFEELAQKGRKR